MTRTWTADLRPLWRRALELRVPVPLWLVVVLAIATTAQLVAFGIIAAAR